MTAELRQTVWRETTRAVRGLRRDPALLIAAVMIIAVATGAGAALFSVVRAVWLRPLPVAEPDRLVRIERPYLPDVSIPTFASVADYVDWKTRNHVFSDLGMAVAARQYLSTGSSVRAETAFLVSPNLFDVLGVQPLLGRLFSASSGASADDEGVVIGERVWRDVFHGDPGVIGRQVTLTSSRGQAAMFRVLGVVPQTFQLDYNVPRDLYLVFRNWPKDRQNRKAGGLGSQVFGRLREGVSVEQAQAEMVSLCAVLQREFPGDRRGPAVLVRSYRDALVGGGQSAVAVLSAATLLLSLAGCFSVSGLLLARHDARARETAVQAALGASRIRLAWEPILPSLIVGGAGCALGLLLAMWAVRTMLATAAPSIPRFDETRVDLVVFGFGAALAMLMTVSAGLVAGIRSARISVASALKAGLTVTPASSQQIQEALILPAVAIAVVLAVVGYSLTASAWRMQHLELGFATEDVLVIDYEAPPGVFRDDTERTLYQARVVQQLRSLAGVTGVSAADNVPFSYGGLNTVSLGDEREREAIVAAVDAAYFRVLGLQVLAGHDPGSAQGAGLVGAVVNREFVRRYGGGRDPLGQRVKVRDQWWEIVGVVADTLEIGRVERGFRWKGLETSNQPWVFVPGGADLSTIVLRTNAPVGQVERAARNTMVSMLPQVAFKVETMQARVDARLADTRFLSLVVACYAAVALVLAFTSIHAVVAHVVGRRRRDIGICLALGARLPHLAKLAAGRTVASVLGGVVIGAGLALVAIVRWRGLLFDSGSADSIGMGGTLGLILVVATMAALVPIIRARRLDVRHSLAAD